MRIALAAVATLAFSCAAAVSAASADVWKTLHRPLHIPRIDSGATCPATRAGVGGVVKPRMAGGDKRLVLHLDFPARRTSAYYGSPWSAQKVEWEVRESYRGPLLIRGRQVDGSTALRFERGQIPARERRIHKAAKPRGSRLYQSMTRIRSPGCYAFQVDGIGFSRVFVFEATANGPLNVGDVTAAFRARGLPMAPAGPFRSNAFDNLVHITGQRFENPAGEIVLWQFPTFRAVHNLLIQQQGRTVVLHLKPSGILGSYIFCLIDPAEPETCQYFDVPSPHWYRNGTALALYLGNDAAMLKTMEELLGEQFAGV